MISLVAVYIFILNLLGPLSAGYPGQQDVGDESERIYDTVELSHLSVGSWRRAIGVQRVAADAVFVHILLLHVVDFVQVMLGRVVVGVGVGRFHGSVSWSSSSKLGIPGQPLRLLKVS